MTIDIKTTKVFTDISKVIDDENYRYFILEGSSRSSKTISLLQILFLRAIKNPNEDIVIVMETLADIKRTMLKKTIPMMLDMFKGLGIKYNKSEHIIYFSNGSLISFIGAENESAVLGLESTILWIDEANKISGEVLRQLFGRNTNKIIMSYNPAGDLSTIDEYKQKPKAYTHYSYYKDNPFLTDLQIEEIEGWEHTDYNHYLIYALGMRTVTKDSIYQHFKPIDEMPVNKYHNFIYGLDFGFHTNAISRIWYNMNNNEVHIEEVLYSHEQSITEFLEEMDSLGLEKNVQMVGDSASRAIIEDIKKKGYLITGANKVGGSVLDGINLIKTLKVTYDRSALNIANELVLYKWKKRNGKNTTEPVKEHDHISDSWRYGIQWLKKYNKINQQFNTKRSNFFKA